MIRFGLSLPLSANIQQLLELTSKAEKYDFDYVFFPDHIVSLDGKEPLNIWSVLSILAMNSKRIGVGSMVANIYRQHPSTLRQHVNTLKQFSSKIMIGLGAGMMFDCKPFGIERSHPLERMMDSVAEIEDLKVPIVVGAYGPMMKEIAAGTNGWVSRHAPSPAQFKEEMSEVEYSVNRFDNHGFKYIADVPVSFDDKSWLWKSLAYRYLLQTKYRNKIFTKELRKNIELDSLNVPRSTLESFSAVGDEEQIINTLGNYIDSGANMFSIRLYGNSFDRFSKVIEYIKSNH